MAACSSSVQQVPNAISGKVCSAKHGVFLSTSKYPILREKYERAEMCGKENVQVSSWRQPSIVSQVHGSGGSV
jgi:hypothetical protein